VAFYWGSNTSWGVKGDGTGPWVAADLENGMFKADRGGKGSDTLSFPNAKTISVQFASTFLKGPADSTFAIKAGNAQSGRLTSMWNGPRPSPNYYPKKLQGAVLLGTGGDGSRAGTGTFFEGAMTIGNPPDSVDEKVQANIVAAGYARPLSNLHPASEPLAQLRMYRSSRSAIVVADYQISHASSVELQLIDLSGRVVARHRAGWIEKGPHSSTLDGSQIRRGIYVARLLVDGNPVLANRFLVAS